MNSQVELIINQWKEVINSIEIKGISKKIESVNYFRMDKYYKGYPEIKYCYKVNFDFGLDGGSYSPTNRDSKWSSEFTDKWKEIINEKLLNDLEFDYDLIDYVTNQNHRIIIQFYPIEGLKRLRDKRIYNLLKKWKK